MAKYKAMLFAKRLSLTLLLMPLASGAATLKVLKTRGNRALVEFDRQAPAVGTDMRVKKNDPDEDSFEHYNDPPEEPYSLRDRKYIIDLYFDYEDPLVQGAAVTVDSNAKFGWNLGHVEVGPTLVLSNDGTSTSFGMGGFFDWNFYENRPNQIWAPGLAMDLNFLKNSDSTTVHADFGAFFKFWILRQSASAIRLDLKYGFDHTSTGTVRSVIFGLGIETYF